MLETANAFSSILARWHALQKFVQTIFAGFPPFLIFMASPITMPAYMQFSYFGWILFLSLYKLPCERKNKTAFLHRNTFILRKSISIFYSASLIYPTVQYCHRTGWVTNTFIKFILFSQHVWKKCVTFYLIHLNDIIPTYANNIFIYYYFVYMKGVQYQDFEILFGCYFTTDSYPESDLWTFWNTAIACPSLIKFSVTLEIC